MDTYLSFKHTSTVHEFCKTIVNRVVRKTRVIILLVLNNAAENNNKKCLKSRFMIKHCSLAHVHALQSYRLTGTRLPPPPTKCLVQGDIST